MLRPLIFAALLACAFWVSQEFIYEPFVVPALGAVMAVPLSSWVAVLAPELLVCVVATFAFRRVAEALAFCLVGGFAVTSMQVIAGLASQPGHLKVIEGGLLQFTTQFVFITTLLLVVVAGLALVRLGVQCVRAR